MKVILKENVASLGKLGDTVKVSDGYARNYLIPKGLAVEADEKTLKVFAEQKKQILKQAEKIRKSAEATAAELQGLTLTIARRVGEQDKLFGSVNSKDIESALKDRGLAIERKAILLDEPIKAVGEFPVQIKLPAGVTAEITICVVAEA
jgi:large subunit ribosomal protein L9